MISLNPMAVGKIDTASRQVIENEQQQEATEVSEKERNRRVRHKATKKYRKKQKNVIEAQKVSASCCIPRFVVTLILPFSSQSLRGGEHERLKKMHAQQKEEQKEKEKEAEMARGGAPPPALERFKPK